MNLIFLQLAAFITSCFEATRNVFVNTVLPFDMNIIVCMILHNYASGVVYICRVGIGQSFDSCFNWGVIS